MDAPQAARGLALLRQVDPLSHYRDKLRDIAAQRNDWAGIPMLLDGLELVIEPTYPNADKLMAMSAERAPEEDDGAVFVNSFWSSRKQSDLLIWRERDGRTNWGLIPGIHSFDHQLQTLGAADVWGIEQEARAVQLLGTMLRHRQFKQYLMTGSFCEKSDKSGVHYMFRKLRPTIAFKEGCGHPWLKSTGGLRLMCALCLHPIGYYAGSWSGAMCPTDDVVAHLTLMRSDERLYWRRANQIPPHRPNAGL